MDTFQINKPLKHIQMPQLLNFICTLITLFVINATVTAQEQTLNDKNISSIIGKWEGNIVVNETKSVGILWRFEKSDQGKLIGFMGPASKGVAGTVNTGGSGGGPNNANAPIGSSAGGSGIVIIRYKFQ